MGLVILAACARDGGAGEAKRDSPIAATLAGAQVTFDPASIREGQRVELRPGERAKSTKVALAHVIAEHRAI